MASIYFILQESGKLFSKVAGLSGILKDPKVSECYGDLICTHRISGWEYWSSVAIDPASWKSERPEAEFTGPGNVSSLSPSVLDRGWATLLVRDAVGAKPSDLLELSQLWNLWYYLKTPPTHISYSWFTRQTCVLMFDIFISLTDVFPWVDIFHAINWISW